MGDEYKSCLLGKAKGTNKERNRCPVLFHCIVRDFTSEGRGNAKIFFFFTFSFKTSDTKQSGLFHEICLKVSVHLWQAGEWVT